MPLFYRLRNGRKFELLPCVLPVVQPRRHGVEEEGGRRREEGGGRRMAAVVGGSLSGSLEVIKQAWSAGVKSYASLPKRVKVSGSAADDVRGRNW